jgi:hypothetical protein
MARLAELPKPKSPTMADYVPRSAFSIATLDILCSFSLHSALVTNFNEIRDTGNTGSIESHVFGVLPLSPRMDLAPQSDGASICCGGNQPKSGADDGG